MKKTLLIALGGLMLVGGMSSCKKGENDPALSFKSRKARVVGEWTVSSSTGSDKTVSGSNTEQNTYTYDGTTQTTVQTLSNGGGSISNTSTDNFTVKYVFDKDGTYTSTYSDSDGVSVTKGDWMFLGKSKNAELKNKEGIMMTTTTMEFTPTGGSTSTMSQTGLDNNSVWLIDQLKGKEMILKYSDSSGSGTNTQESETTITLTLD